MWAMVFGAPLPLLAPVVRAVVEEMMVVVNYGFTTQGNLFWVDVRGVRPSLECLQEG